jgi:paraquat-inducible protein A
MATDRPALICEECDTLTAVRRVPSGVTAQCSVCGNVLYRERQDSVRRALALTLAAFILLLIAHAFPFMTFTMEGNSTSGTIFGSVMALWHDGYWELAIVVLTMASLMPFIRLALGLWVLVPLTMGRVAPGTFELFGLYSRFQAWAMIEVYLIGVLVAYTKLVDLASIHLGPAMWAFGGLIVCAAAADNVLDPRAVWWRLAPQNKLGALTATGQPLVGCHVCGQVVPLPVDAHHVHCPRCHAALHHRKPDPLARTWALLIAAALLYIPANVLPVMTVTSFGKGQPDTILSGVIELIHADMWPIAALVFFASITVPVLKILGLVLLLVAAQRGWVARARDQTRLYRVIEQVGRWSMIDIFMISILAVLVNLGEIAQIEPGPGAIAFASVVILTMLAAHSFEPRIIWDNRRRNHATSPA